LDLNYPEDRDASVDFNVVTTEKGEFVELQGSGEEATFSDEEMAKMLGLARKGIAEIVVKQKAAIVAADEVSGVDLAAAFGG